MMKSLFKEHGGTYTLGKDKHYFIPHQKTLRAKLTKRSC